MVIGCPKCNTRFRVDPSKIPAGGRTLLCGHCQHQFRVEAPPSPAPAPSERGTLGTIGCLRPEAIAALEAQNAARAAGDGSPAAPEPGAASTIALPAAALMAATAAAGGIGAGGPGRGGQGRGPEMPARRSAGPTASTASQTSVGGTAPGALATPDASPDLELDLDLDLDLDASASTPDTAPMPAVASTGSATAPMPAVAPTGAVTAPMPAVASPPGTAGEPMPAAVPADATRDGDSRWILTEPSGEENCVDRYELRERIRHGAVTEETLLRPFSGGDPVPAGEIEDLQRYFRLKRGGPAPAANPGLVRGSCGVHPGKTAEHMCTVCHTLYCAICVDTKQFGSTRVSWCRKCDDRCVPFEGIRNVVPFWRQIPRLLKYPLEGWGPFMMLCCSVLSFMGSFLPGPGKALYFLVLAYQLHILKESSEGKTKLPDWPDMSDVYEITARGLKGVFVTLIAWSPVIVFNLVFFAHTLQSLTGAMGPVLSTSADTRTADDDTAAPYPDGEIRMEDYVDENGTFDFERYRRDQIAAGGWEDGSGEPVSEDALASVARAGILFAAVNLVLIPFVLLYYPMCLMIAAIFNTVLPALNPVLIARCISRIKADYAMALLFCGILAVGGVVVQIFFSLIPLVGVVVNAVIGSYLTFVQMHILGWTAHQGWDRLNWDIKI